MSRRLDVAAYVDGVRRGDRAVLAQAITLLESERADDAERAQAVLSALAPESRRARRVGVTGAPGVGKSTFIDALGLHLVRERKARVAVLSIDPSSPRTGGSILGDKTRMGRLSLEPQAYIRPTPSRGMLGGIAKRTGETICLCEAAGFDVVIVETVGVGQSETAVRDLVETLILLLLPAGGDELQGMKRGLLEVVDIVAVNKADGALAAQAERTRAEYAAAAQWVPPDAHGRRPVVTTCSALTGIGIAEVWEMVLAHQSGNRESGNE